MRVLISSGCLAVFALLTSAVALPACGDDSGGEDDGTGGSSSDPDGGGTGGGGNGENCGDTFDSCATGEVFDGETECCIDAASAETLCKERAVEQSPGSPTDDPTCGAGCTCTNCAQQMLDCGTDPDNYCAEILKCAQETGCLGVACYMPATCQAVIDAAPNGGVQSYSLALASAISECAEPAGCSSSCD